MEIKREWIFVRFSFTNVFSREREEIGKMAARGNGGKTEDNGGEEIGWHKARSNSCYSRLGEHDQNVARIYELDNQQHPH